MMKALAALFLTFASAAQPLADRHLRLLTTHRYAVKDGSVRDPNGASVPESEVPFVLHRLESAQRLRALLQINIILNKSEGEKRLTAAESEAIRAVVKENWAYFPLATRKDFKRYFSLEELEQLNAAPPPIAEAAVFELKDQEPEISEVLTSKPERKGWFKPKLPAFMRPAAALPEPAPAPAAPPVPLPVAPAVAPVEPAAAPVAIAAAPAAPPAAVPAPPPPGPAALPVYGTVDPPAPQPVAVPAPADLPAPRVDVLRPSTSAPAGFVFGQGEAPAPVAAIVPTLPPQPPAPPPASKMPKLEPVTQEALELFLHSAPYGREAKALLRLIHQRAPAAARDRALNTVFFALPAILLDDAKAADGWSSSLSAAEPHVVALRPGLTLLKKRRMLIASEELVLPESFDFAGLKAPALGAYARKGAAKQEKDGEWGELRVYEDGSKRAPVSPEQQAGALLYELLRLDAKLRGADGSRAAVELWARGFQSLFYSAVQNALGHDRFLDPSQRLSLRRWLDHPDEERDHLYLALASARSGAIDAKRGSPSAQHRHDEAVSVSCETSVPPEAARRAGADKARHERLLDALNETGLFESGSIKASRAAFKAATPAVGCAPLPPSKLLAELNAAEGRFRQDRLGAAAQ